MPRKLVEGKASMNVNYALEPGEVERGYVLACQAHVEGEGLWCLTSTSNKNWRQPNEKGCLRGQPFLWFDLSRHQRSKCPPEQGRV